MSKEQLLKPLPDCEGPKLQPYDPTGHVDIRFLEFIGEGLHARVVKVEINGQNFALKVFKNTYVAPNWLFYSLGKVSAEEHSLLVNHKHPFNAECRAYARLQEVGQEDLVTRCHGYIELDRAQEKEIEKLCGTSDWWIGGCSEAAAADGYVDYVDSTMTPRRALLKDLMEGNVPFRPKQARKMVKDVRSLHRCGILVRDIKEDAYIEGKLVDLSKAITIPNVHFTNQILKECPEYLDSKARSEALNDMKALDDVLRPWSGDQRDFISHTASWATWPVMQKLRNGRERYNKRDDCWFDVRTVDWKKFQRDWATKKDKTHKVQKQALKTDRKMEKKSST